MPDRPTAAATARPRLGGMALANGLLVHGPTHWAAAVQRADGSDRRRLRPQAPRRHRGHRRSADHAGRAAHRRVRRRAARDAPQPSRSALRRRGARGGLHGRRARSWPVSSPAGACAHRSPRRPSRRSSASRRPSSRCAPRAPQPGTRSSTRASRRTRPAAPTRSPARTAYPKEHQRCGSNLVVPMMAATVATNLLLRALPAGRRPGMRTVAGAIAIGTAVEAFAFATRHPEHPVARGDPRDRPRHPGRVATKEPEDAEMLVGRGRAARDLPRRGDRRRR